MTTTQAREFRTRFFDRNGVTGEAWSANGIRQYCVTDTRTGDAMATTVSSLALRVAREWAQRPDAPARQIESPLPAVERQSSGLAGPSGSAANAMSEPVRRMLAEAAGRHSGLVLRGARRDGFYPLPMLRAAVRRGWLTPVGGTKYAFDGGQITEAGARALEYASARTNAS